MTLARSLNTLLAYSVAASAAPGSASPPLPAPFPAAFSVRFVETLAFGPTPSPPNPGAWFYNFKDQQWRADHDAPQQNNFCACADNTTTQSCHLLFAPDALYADFPDAPDTCCRVCNASDGCSALIPTWISGAGSARTYAGNATIDGRLCYKYCIPGAEAAADCWAFSVGPAGEQIPCQYAETFNFGAGTTITHNLTFVASTYEVREQPPSLFTVRAACRKECPRVFPTTCG
jgi:hypothetical protein